MVRPLFVVLNTVMPGSGLLLVRPGLWPVLPAAAGIVGLSALAAALLARDLPNALVVGGCGLALWNVSALGSTLWWWAVERVQVRDLAAIRAVWREAAERYLRDDQPAALSAARRVTALAPTEPGAWRLLELTARAGGDARTAALAAARAAALG